MFQCKQSRVDLGLQREAPRATPHPNWGRAPQDKCMNTNWPTPADREDLGWFMSSGYEVGLWRPDLCFKFRAGVGGLDSLCSAVTGCVSALAECLINAFHSSKECGLWAADSWPEGRTVILRLVLQDRNLHRLWAPDGWRWLFLSVTPALGEEQWCSPTQCGSWFWDWPHPELVLLKNSGVPLILLLWTLYGLSIHAEHQPFGTQHLLWSVNKIYLYS